MHYRIGPSLVLMFLVGCSGKTNDDLVGKWKSTSDPYDNSWQFKSDGTFEIAGGSMKSVDGSGKMVPTLPQGGRWTEKDGVLSMTYDGKQPIAYRWKKSANEVSLTPVGEGVAITLRRAD